MHAYLEKMSYSLQEPIYRKTQENKMYSEMLGGHAYQSPLANTDNQGKSF